MLQQTQVAAVIPYYRRFLCAFPTLSALAKAPLERVLELWSGLGYYRRARNLHRAARLIAARFDGKFPSDIRQARSLPGVGDYTARAVLSIAYNLPWAVLDGNVARVVARLRALEGDPASRVYHAAVEGELALILSRRRPGDFNQALMELGQTVCTPRAPNCGCCPLRRFCAAYRLGRVEDFPAPRPRRPGVLRYLAAAVIHRSPSGRGHSEVALTRGLDEGLLSDLWNFPSAFGASRREANSRLKEKLSHLSRAEIHFGKPCAELSHSITYRSISVQVFHAKFSTSRCVKSFRWVSLARVQSIAASKLAQKVAAALLERG